MDESGFKFEVQAFGGNVGVASQVKERVDLERGLLHTLNSELLGAVHNLEEFVESQPFTLDGVVVNRKRMCCNCTKRVELNGNVPK